MVEYINILNHINIYIYIYIYIYMDLHLLLKQASVLPGNYMALCSCKKIYCHLAENKILKKFLHLSLSRQAYFAKRIYMPPIFTTDVRLLN